MIKWTLLANFLGTSTHGRDWKYISTSSEYKNEFTFIVQCLYSGFLNWKYWERFIRYNPVPMPEGNLARVHEAGGVPKIVRFHQHFPFRNAFRTNPNAHFSNAVEDVQPGCGGSWYCDSVLIIKNRGCADGVMYSGLEWNIEKPSSYYSRGRYIHLREKYP